jgi:hypothetical protein
VKIVEDRRVHLILIVLVSLGLGLVVRSVIHADVSAFTAGVIVGVFATMSLVGIVYGLFEGRRLERRRKAQIDIWLKH